VHDIIKAQKASAHAAKGSHLSIAAEDISKAFGPRGQSSKLLGRRRSAVISGRGEQVLSVGRPNVCASREGLSSLKKIAVAIMGPF